MWYLISMSTLRSQFPLCCNASVNSLSVSCAVFVMYAHMYVLRDFGALSTSKSVIHLERSVPEAVQRATSHCLYWKVKA